jgi:hypothetical protein
VLLQRRQQEAVAIARAVGHRSQARTAAVWVCLWVSTPMTTSTDRQLVAASARLRIHADWDVETASTAAALRSLARRIRELTAEAADHRQATLALVRACRPDPATRAYAERRRAQGKTNREIKRCLVRYIARQLYRLLETQPTLDTT